MVLQTKGICIKKRQERDMEKKKIGIKKDLAMVLHHQRIVSHIV